MERVDETYLYSDYYTNKYFDHYQKFNILKTSSLLLIMKMIFSFLISFFIVYIMVINDILNLINIGIVVIFVTGNYLVEKYYFIPKSRNISALENRLKKVNNKSEFVSLTKSVNKLGYRYGLAYKFKRYITVGCYLFTAVLIMAISSSTPIDISYLVFNVVIMVLLDQYLNDIFSCENHYRQFLDSKAYISQYFHR